MRHGFLCPLIVVVSDATGKLQLSAQLLYISRLLRTQSVRKDRKAILPNTAGGSDWRLLLPSSTFPIKAARRRESQGPQSRKIATRAAGRSRSTPSLLAHHLWLLLSLTMRLLLSVTRLQMIAKRRALHRRHHGRLGFHLRAYCCAACRAYCYAACRAYCCAACRAYCCAACRAYCAAWRDTLDL